MKGDHDGRLVGECGAGADGGVCGACGGVGSWPDSGLPAEVRRGYMNVGRALQELGAGLKETARLLEALRGEEKREGIYHEGTKDTKEYTAEELWGKVDEYEMRLQPQPFGRMAQALYRDRYYAVRNAPTAKESIAKVVAEIERYESEDSVEVYHKGTKDTKEGR